MVGSLFLIYIFFAECQPNTTYEEQKSLIEMIKTKTSPKTIQCKFFYTLTKNDSFNKFIHENYYSSQPKSEFEKTLSNFFQNETCTYYFAYDGWQNNLFISKENIITPEQIKQSMILTIEYFKSKNYSIDSKTIAGKNKTLLDIIQTILEQRDIHRNKLFVEEYEKKLSKIANLQDLNEIYKELDTSKEEIIVETNECNYIYKGQPKVRVLYSFLNGDKRIDVYDGDFPVVTSVNPLTLLGVVGYGATDNFLSTWGFRLCDILDSPGPFHIKQEGDFTILWHKTRVKEEILDESEEISIDIWINTEGDICRIDHVIYPAREWENYQPPSWFTQPYNCDSPKIISQTIECKNFVSFPHGVRLPLEGKIKKYEVDVSTEEGKFLVKKLYNRELSREEWLLRKSTVPHFIQEEIDIFIYPDTLKVNEPIPEETFIAPEPEDMNKSQWLWGLSKRTILSGIISAVCLLSFISLYFSKKYLFPERKYTR